jgi:hypothetical protein
VARISITAIIGVVFFGLASMALAIIGLFTDFMSSDDSSNATLLLVGSGACTIATIVCAFLIRRR